MTNTIRISSMGGGTSFVVGRGNSTAIRRSTTTPTGPVTALFFSDWSFATGSSASAKNDNGKWNAVTPTFGQIISTTGLDFPATMTNCFRVPWDETTISAGRKTGLGVPNVGSSRYYRFYFRNVQPNVVSDTNYNTHPVQDGNAAGDCNWSFNVENSGVNEGVINGVLATIPDDKWQLAIQSAVGAPYGPNKYFLQTFLDKNVTYRVEIHLSRLTTTTFELHAKVYNSSDVLIFSDADFQETDGSGTMASNTAITFNNVNNLDGLNCGCNDNGLGDGGYYSYQGGFAVADDQGWIGPYGNILGEG